ncbi:unnamed protein product [Ambrosiozyma monospora]|uniref:Unnamed protein product n=1 Tax=Ambrosiozyma monospora TaxID=43982 RepID=A0A9W6YP82_AMBMO|nr:unnamed protein product [Ambrosiozyma monospora]
MNFKMMRWMSGWSDDSQSSGSSSDGASKEDIVMPYVKVLSNFRDLVRSSAIDKADYKVLLTACDELRDKELLKLNVSLDDRSDKQGALVKFLTDSEREELIKQQEEKIRLQQEKEAKKLQQKKAAEAKEHERLAKGKLSPLDMFKTEEFKKLYSEWDDEGLPTKTVQGEEVTKSAKKKLAKQQNQQKKLHDEYLKKTQA